MPDDILIKSINFDGVKKIGDPELFSNEYYLGGFDEIMIINNTGSLYDTKLNPQLLTKIRKNKNCPISAGGGIKQLEDAIILNDNGADKVVLNSLIHTNLSEVEKIINYLGGASVVGSIQTEKKDNVFKTFYEMSRESSGKTLEETIDHYIKIGIGEIMITSIENDGCFLGLNEEIMRISKKYMNQNPILISGGVKNEKCLESLDSDISGIVLSSSLHYKRFDYKNFLEIKKKYD